MKQFFFWVYALSFSAAVFTAGMFVGHWLVRMRPRRPQAYKGTRRGPASSLSAGQLEESEAVEKEN